MFHVCKSGLSLSQYLSSYWHHSPWESHTNWTIKSPATALLFFRITNWFVWIFMISLQTKNGAKGNNILIVETNYTYWVSHRRISKYICWYSTIFDYTKYIFGYPYLWLHTFIFDYIPISLITSRIFSDNTNILTTQMFYDTLGSLRIN